MRLLGGLRSARGEFERGTAAARAGRLAEAIVSLRRAIEIKPDYSEAHFNLAAAYRDLGDLDAALAQFRRTVGLVPRFFDAHLAIGNLLRERREFDEAERSLRAALALRPDDPHALLELGNARKNLGDWREALGHFRRALEVAPDFGRARWAAAVSPIPAIEEDDTDSAERREAFGRELGALESWAAADPQAYRAVAEHQPFFLAYQELPNRELLARYGRLCSSLMLGWQRAAGLEEPRRRQRNGALRVGIVSAHFFDHSVWQAFLRGWVERLDRRRFELHLFRLSKGRDAETDRAASLATAFHDGQDGWEEWARTIHDSRMDVLLYPEIGMDPTTAKLAAMRLAPVQAASWGHPETSGLPTMDYYLSAEAIEPPNGEEHYTEKLERLPGTGCWLPRAAEQPGAADWAALGVPPGLKLLCPGASFKYAAQHDALLVDIARRVPEARLVFFHTRPPALSARLERRLRAAFDRAGLAYQRHVVFVPWQDGRSFRAVLASADLYLDTLGFSGFNTALQAVRCGLPVVAREGRFMRGRLASGILRHIGVDELVVASDAAYVELVVALAKDPRRREALRQRIGAASGRLFEDDAPVRALESFLERVSA
jgi:predicted O-linked N-acetylglucosamine transferase (SPINDLY family)